MDNTTNPFDSSHWSSVTNTSFSFVPEIFVNPYLEIDRKEHVNKVNQLRLDKRQASDTEFLHLRKKTASLFEQSDKLKQKILQTKESAKKAKNEYLDLEIEIEQTEMKINKELQLTKIQEERVMQLLMERNGERIVYPKTWEPQTENCKLINLSEDSEEFIRVANRFNETMKDHVLTKVCRIQNKWLWGQYYHERWKLEEKNKGKVNELEYFHGSSSAHPDLIYNGEEGFDMRFSAYGFWGRGIYFAHNASYSFSYAYENTMFLVQLLAGDSVELQHNSSLVCPPLKPSSNSDLHFEGERYDSVNGITYGCRVFILYTNGRAYPKYLISFERK